MYRNLMKKMQSKQKGFTIIELMVALGILATLAIGAYLVLRGQSRETEMQRAVTFAVRDIRSALATMYYAQNRTYANIDTGRLQSTLGTTDTSMPWAGDTWSVTGTPSATGIDVTYQTNNGPLNNGTASAATCTELRARLSAYTTQAGLTLGACPAATPWTLAVTYARP